ncbi:hypothetical protein ACYQR9_21660 [Methylobacterium sp. CM6241]
MRFERQWSADEITCYEVIFTIEELQAAAAATGLDVTAFRGIRAYHYDNNSEHEMERHGMDAKAVAHMQPLVVDALVRRDLAITRSCAWRMAKLEGWRVLDVNWVPVPEPAAVGENW